MSDTSSPRSTGGWISRLSDLRQWAKPPRQDTHVRRFEPEGPDAQHSVAPLVSMPLRIAAAWSWRIIIVGVAIYFLVYGLRSLASLVIALLLALLFAVLLDPVNRFLIRKWRFPSALSAAVTLILGLGVVVTLVSVASSQILSQMDSLVWRAAEGFGKATTWLTEGPLHLKAESIDHYSAQFVREITEFAHRNSGQLANGALSFTSSVAEVGATFLIVLFTLFFFLKEGRQIWLWCVRILPEPARVPVHESAIRGWITLGSYVRTQILVAAIDAVGIGAGAYFLSVPLAIPIAVLVFVGAFVPIVGAIVTGAIAVLVALVDQGFQTAVLMLLVILIVQQVESNLLQPWLMSNAVSLHPVAVLFGVAAGSYLFGMAGALFSVPIIAFLNTSVLYFHGYDKFPDVATDINRPGGPPGYLDEMIAATYDPTGARVDPMEEPSGAIDSAQDAEKVTEMIEESGPSGEEVVSASESRE